MNNHVVVWRLEIQDLQQIASRVRADAETLRWFMLTVDVEKGDRVRPSVANVLVGQAVPVGRLEDAHLCEPNTSGSESVPEAARRESLVVREVQIPVLQER